MSASKTIHEIDYARLPPWHRRRWFRRACWAGTIAALLAAGPWWWPYIRDRSRLLLLQHRCMVYQAPADRVVLETDPKQITALSRNIGNYKVDGSDLVYSAPEFASFFAKLWSANPFPVSNVFLHSRSSRRNGHDRLVAVFAMAAHDVFDDPYPSLDLEAEVVSPATLFRDAKGSSAQLRTGYSRVFDIKRVYAGQPDSIDSSHFTFTVETQERTLHFDGWLLDDDTVKLEPREGYPIPSTRPATTLPAP